MNNVYNSTRVISELYCQNREGTAGQDNGFEWEVGEMHITAQFSLKIVGYGWFKGELHPALEKASKKNVWGIQTHIQNFILPKYSHRCTNIYGQDVNLVLSELWREKN